MHRLRIVSQQPSAPFRPSITLGGTAGGERPSRRAGLGCDSDRGGGGRAAAVGSRRAVRQRRKRYNAATRQQSCDRLACDRLAERCDIAVSGTTLGQTLQRLGLTRKKPAGERTTPRRREGRRTRSTTSRRPSWFFLTGFFVMRLRSTHAWSRSGVSAAGRAGVRPPALWLVDTADGAGHAPCAGDRGG